jgi:chromosome segregation ATPase
MDTQEIPKLLEQLQSEIAQIERVDAKGRAMLRELDADIHELLARSDEDAQPSPAILRGIQESITHLETTHPSLTTLLSRLLETLSNAGI